MANSSEPKVSWRHKVLDALRALLPRNDLPGAQQATPLNLNRYVLLLLYVIQTFMTGCVYFGWAPLSAMLLKAEVFSFKCEGDGSGAFVDDQREHGHEYICDEQDASVQGLYVITLASHCTMSAFAGAMMDTLGPKITSMLGQCFHIIGWSLISTLEANSNVAVYLGFIFMGLGADTAFLPTLLATRLFPGAAATVITVIGSASSASFAIPLILDSYFTKNGISGCWWYVGFGPGLFLLVDALVMPLKAFKVFEEDVQKSQSDAAIEDLPSPKSPDPVQERTGDSVVESCTRSSSTGLKNDPQHTPKPLKALMNRDFVKTLFSEKYLLITVYFIGVGWATSFYQEAHDRILVPSAQNFLGNALPFSFVPCIILGKLSAHIGILPVIGIVNTTGILAHAFSMSYSEACGIISVLWFMIYTSFFVSQVFVYVEGAFPAVFFGRLIGIVQLVGGLLSLLCSPLFHLAVKLDPNSLYVVQLPMVGLLLLMYFALARLWWLDRKSSDMRKSSDAQVAPAEPKTTRP